MVVLKKRLEYKLKDGAAIFIRLLKPEDKYCLKVLCEKLSSKSKYCRFMSTISQLSDNHLKYLTEMDYVNHFAICALNPSQSNDDIIGVGRYVRIPEEANVSEIALTIRDDYQNRGLGTILLTLLLEQATKAGIYFFRGYILPENKLMLSILKHFDVEIYREDCSLLRIDFKLISLL